MPIYEYRCEKCGKVFEVLQRFSDDPLKIHEDCGGGLEKLISHSAFQLKGGGWYATDYAKGSTAAPVAKTDGKADGAADSKTSEAKTETASESKSETKTESKPAVTTTTKSD
jgi:putative FmdB family regulatory protein